MAGKVKGSGRRRREGVMEEITGHINFVIYFLQEKIPQEKIWRGSSSVPSACSGVEAECVCVSPPE